MNSIIPYNNSYAIASNNTKIINNMLQTSGKVELPSGTIYINDTIFLIKHGNYLIGQGASTRLQLTDKTIKDMIYVCENRCKISNMMIFGNLDSVVDDFKQNKQKYYTGNIGNGVVINKSYRTLLEDVFIHNMILDGVVSTGDETLKSSLTTLHNCVVENCGRHSIHHYKYSQDPIITNTFTQDAWSDGLKLDGNYGSVISNSHFYRNGNNNVSIEGGGRHRFENCTIDRAQRWGVTINYSNDISMSKCILFDNNQSNTNCGAILLGDSTFKCLISQNTIYNDPPVSQNYGIYIKSTSTDNTIAFNEVRNSINENYISENKCNLILYNDVNKVTQKN